MEDTRAWVGRETEPPSGTQHVIQAGQQRATIVEVGRGVREYESRWAAGLGSVPGRRHRRRRPRGTPLLPWPNRLEDGRYVFDGKEYQVPLTEPEKGTAIHGLMRWRPWQPIEVSECHVVMGVRVYPMPVIRSTWMSQWSTAWMTTV